MPATNVLVENCFLHCINSFTSRVLSLLFSDEEPSADESENKHFFSTHFLSGRSCRNRHHPTATAARQPWIPLSLYSKRGNVQRIFSLLWKFFSKSFLWMNWQICVVFPAFYLLALVQNLVPSPSACITGWIWGYFIVMQYLTPVLHFMNIFFLKSLWKFLLQKWN